MPLSANGPRREPAARSAVALKSASDQRRERCGGALLGFGVVVDPTQRFAGAVGDALHSGWQGWLLSHSSVLLLRSNGSSARRGFAEAALVTLSGSR